MKTWEDTVLKLESTNESLRIHMTKMLEQQAKATWEAASREIGEALCILVGNLMLKDMEKGKELGEQMRPLMELCQKNAGITFNIKEG